MVLAAIAFAGCGERPKLARLASDAVVLAFGDSLTYGTGAAENESYPAQLERLIGRRVVRAAVPGEVTAQALTRLPEALDEHAPRLLLLCIGGNDFLRRLGNPQAEANIRAMVQLARKRGVDVVLIGVPEPGLSPAPAPTAPARLPAPRPRPEAAMQDPFDPAAMTPEERDREVATLLATGYLRLRRLRADSGTASTLVRPSAAASAVY